MLIVSWTDEQAAELTTLVTTTKMTGGEIAKKLGRTRNAIIGKLRRLKLNLPNERPNFIKLTLEERAERSNRAKREKRRLNPKSRIRYSEPAAQPMPMEPLCISLLDLGDGHCREIVGEPKDNIYCGHTKKDGSSYCPFHSSINERLYEVREKPYSRSERRVA